MALLVVAGSLLAAAGGLADAGDLDPTFGIGGVVFTDFTGSTSEGNGPALAIDSAGRYLLAGSSQTNVGPPYLVLTRYQADGSLDESFGDGGVASLEHFQMGTEAEDLVIDAAGRILVAGGVGRWSPTGVLLARFHADGSLDPAFGDQGIVLGDQGPRGAVAVALDPLGRIVVAGSSGGDVVVARYDEAGGLDPGFGETGQVVVDLGSAWDAAVDVAVKGDEVLVAGRTWGAAGTWDFALASLTEDGSLRGDFGSGGIVIEDLTGSQDYAAALGVDSLGRILMAGYAYEGIAVVRFDGNGGLDATFDGDGIALMPFGIGLPEAAALVVDVDDSILVAGTARPAGDQEMLVCRFDPDGSLSDDFGGDGLATVGVAGSPDRAVDLGVAADGAVLLSGSSSGPGWDRDFVLARFEQGVLDPTFGTDGLASVEILGSTWDEAQDLVAVQADGKIAVAGAAWGAERVEMAVARYTADGLPDLGFGEAGEIRSTFGYDEAYAYSVLVDSLGRLLLAGEVQYEERYDLDLAVVRLLPDGSPDPAFGTQGVAAIDVSGALKSDYPAAAELDAAGRIVVTGSSSASPFLARLDATGSLDPTFGDGGIVRWDLRSELGARWVGVTDMAIDAQGRILIAGGVTSYNWERSSFVARFDTHGSLDPGFSGDGFLMDDLGLLFWLVEAIGVDSAGRILVTGRGVSGTWTDPDVTVARYHDTGELDTSFGQGGLVLTDLGFRRHDHATDLVVDAEDRIVVAGWGGGGPTEDDYAVLRYDSSGFLDPGFGTGGLVLVDLNQAAGEVEPSGDRAAAVTLDARGSILVAGESYLWAPGFGYRRRGADFGLIKVQGVTAPDWDLELLVEEVQGLVPELLNHGQATSLLAKLQAAIQQTDAGHPETAILQLDALINEVQALLNAGILPQDEGDLLLEAASAIQATL